VKGSVALKGESDAGWAVGGVTASVQMEMFRKNGESIWSA